MPLPLDPVEQALPLQDVDCPACGLGGWLWGAVIPSDLADLFAARSGHVLLTRSGLADDGGIACLACGWESEAGPRPPAH